MLLFVLHCRGAVTGQARTLPDRPVLKPWYRLLQLEDRVLLQYGEALVTFEGQAATRLLPALLPLLDGSRSVDEIVHVLGPPVRRAVEQALDLLQEQGLVTDPAPDFAPEAERRSAEFLAATDPSGSSAAQLLAIVGSARIAVAGSGSLAFEVASALRRSGITGAELYSLPLDSGELSHFELLIAAPSGEEVPHLSSWNRAALEARVPWLQVLPFDGHFSAVGPFYVPGETGCYECFRTRRASNVDYGRTALALQEVGASLPAAPSLELTIAGLAATLALRWLAHGDQFLPGTWYALELGLQPLLGGHVLYRVPRCAACSGIGEAAQPLPWHRAA